MTSLTDWYTQPLGQALSHFENAELQHLLPKYQGQCLLQVGGHALLPALGVSPIAHRFGITQATGEQNQGSFIYSSYGQLPIASDSTDVVILWHSLETEKHPETILTEAWRTLKPDGHLIILGFNPLSLWGLRRLLDHHIPPWNGHFHNAQKICNWVAHANGEIITAKSFFFRPPLQNQQLMHQLRWLEAIGIWLWPHMGGVYLLDIQKRTLPLTPAKLSWGWQTELATDKSLSATTGSMRRD